MAASKSVVKAKAKTAKSKVKAVLKQVAKPNGKAARRAADVEAADPALFDPLTRGETADALRTLIEDKRVSSMAKVGRYRIICTEPRDYANPIEPSGTGGEKIAQAIVRAVTTSHLSV